MNRLIVTIGKKVWSVGRVTADAIINTAKEGFNNDAFVIIALEKGSNIEMRKDTYSSKVALTRAVNSYRKKGFKVYYLDGSAKSENKKG